MTLIIIIKRYFLFDINKVPIYRIYIYVLFKYNNPFRQMIPNSTARVALKLIIPYFLIHMFNVVFVDFQFHIAVPKWIYLIGKPTWIFLSM